MSEPTQTDRYPFLEAARLADELLDAHRRVREAAGARSGVRYEVSPLLPADLLGVFVYLPVAPS